MKIEIKKSTKPVNYTDAIRALEERLDQVLKNKAQELIWTLYHSQVYTGGTSYNESELLDKKINLIKTNRGGKITWHGPGQLICYFVIDLNKRTKDVRKFLNVIENTIIETLNEYNIKAFSDKENIGIWINKGKQIKKIAAIGIRIRKWVAYHGFAINIDNSLKPYKKIIACGIKDKGIANLKSIKIQDYTKLSDKIIANLIKNLEI
tara:strand:+ start:60 stop:680 length:621 start_codon:yes stop_codon:yes gene_type:complete